VRTVQMIGGLIYRNETYFDTLHLITAIRDWNTEKETRRKPPGVVEVNVRPL
jgi:hypothetical protein